VVTGNSDTIEMMGTSAMTQSGASDSFVFQAAIGVEKITGFASTDSMQFSASDFANFAAMMSHTIQSGSATVIKLDATDKVTLTNTLDTSLVASQFHFV
jgi:hypothetical protein